MGGEAYIRGRMAIAGVERTPRQALYASILDARIRNDVYDCDRARLAEYDTRQAVAMIRPLDAPGEAP